MALTFNNVDTQGYRWAQAASDSQWWNNGDLATPTDADAAGDFTGGIHKLLVYFGVSGQPGVSIADFVLSLTNVTGETEIASIAHTNGNLQANCLAADLTSAPTSLIATSSPDNGARLFKAGLIFAGHNEASPIRASAVSYGSANSGNSYALTFPDTASVNDGDVIIRFASVLKTNDEQTATDLSGHTNILKNLESYNYASFNWLAYATKSGAGTPGTATSTLNSIARDYVSMTIVVAASGGGSSADPLASQICL